MPVFSPYEVVVTQEERQLQNVEFRFRASRIGFLTINIFISILIVGGFFIVRFTDTFRPRPSNITEYCKDPSYNITPIPNSSYFAAYASIVATLVLCFALPLITNYLAKHDVGQLIKNVLWKTWILGMHLICLSIFMEFMKCATGIPRPYFFSSQNITNIYCENNKIQKRLSVAMEKLDHELRKSFPSYRSAMYTFSVTFMYIYVDHFDIGIGLHASQYVLMMILGSYLTYVQLYSWDQGENHLSDLLVGGSIGIIQAMITVRDMFGSVFHSH